VAANGSVRGLNSSLLMEYIELVNANGRKNIDTNVKSLTFPALELVKRVGDFADHSDVLPIENKYYLPPS